jgi:iron complex outermembrane receptor protein
LLAAAAAVTAQAQDVSAVTSAGSAAASSSQTGSLDSLLDMADKDVGQLSQVHVSGATGSQSLDMPVSSVSRQDSTVGRSPAAVFVITNDMIRRSGAKTIPEVLRMVPGLDVAQIDSNKWAITCRGMNGRFADELLVQIDGRVVYDPLFSGVFWDVQDVLLEDVERIEVIRGPGATVWGLNAVNGVINIITKNAKDTQGVYLESGGGTHEQGFSSLRYGGQISDNCCYRLYGKWFDTGPYFSPDFQATDEWEQVRGGFRMDWHASADDTITFQGDYYNGYDGDEAEFASVTSPYYVLEHDITHVQGDDVLLNWRRVLGERSDWTALVYFDQTERHWTQYDFGENQDTFNFDYQYRCPLGARNELICGTGYRRIQCDTYSFNPDIYLVPPDRPNNIYSCFVQDQFTVREDLLFLTVGSKFERDDFTGFEWEPSIRLLMTPSKNYSLWASVSRAVRIPSVGEEDVRLISLPNTQEGFPIYPFTSGNPNLLSEEMIAYEAGVRGQPTEKLSWDLAFFSNNYDRLTLPVPGPAPELSGPIVIWPLTVENAAKADSYGFELAANYKVTPAWQLRLSYSSLVMHFGGVPGVPNVAAEDGLGPRNLVYAQSSFDLGRHWQLDLIGRYSDNIAAIGVPKYLVGDVRLAWHPNPNLELSVVGRNLCNGKFYEFTNDNTLGAMATEVVPEVYGQIAWRY